MEKNMENMEKENQLDPMKRSNKQKGVTVVEYALMLALIAIAVAIATPSISDAVLGVFSQASSIMGN